MATIEESWHFAIPLLLAAAAVILLASTKRRLSKIKLAVLLLAVAGGGFASIRLMYQGLASRPLLMIEEVGIEVPLPEAPASATQTTSTPKTVQLPWTLGDMTSGPSIEAASTVKGLSFTPSVEFRGSVLLRAGDAQTPTRSLDEHPWCMLWKPGQTLRAAGMTLTLQREEVKRDSQGLRKFIDQVKSHFGALPLVRFHSTALLPPVNTQKQEPLKLPELTRVRFPTALALSETVYLTRPPIGHASQNEGVWILALYADQAQPTLKVDNNDIQAFSAALQDSMDGWLEAAVWLANDRHQDADSAFPKLGRFEDTCRFQVSARKDKLSLQRVPAGGQTLLPREDTIRITRDFLHKPDVQHFVVSRALYDHPDDPFQQPVIAPDKAQNDIVAEFRRAARKTAQKEVCLTFDDGPHALYTGRVLDLLKQYEMKATFFVMGANFPSAQNASAKAALTRSQALVRRMVLEGHEVANHTLTHSSGWYGDVPTQVGRMNQIISDAFKGAEGGYPLPKEAIDKLTVRYFRPPYGRMGSSRVKLAQRLASDHGLTTLIWSADPADWQNGVSPQQIVSRSLAQLDDGGILLLHDIQPETMQALPDLFVALKREKVKTMTASEMLAFQKDGSEPPPPAPKLPMATGTDTTSYLALGHLPGGWLRSQMQLRPVNPGAQPAQAAGDLAESSRATVDAMRSAAETGALPTSGVVDAELVIGDQVLMPRGKEDPVYHIEGRGDGALLMRVTPVEGDWAAVMALSIATMLAVLVVMLVGWNHSWSAGALTLVFAMSITRFILAVGAERVYPVANLDLWKAWPWDTGVPEVPLAALFGPWLVPGSFILVHQFFHWVRHRGQPPLSGTGSSGMHWAFGFGIGLLVLAAVWLAGGTERIGPIQKSMIYMPLLCALTAYLVSYGAQQLQEQQQPVAGWLRLVLAFALMTLLHMAMAALNGDLGATLITFPLGVLFLSYAMSQPSWGWRVGLVIGLAATAWAGWEGLLGYLEAQYLGEADEWHFPWLARGILAVVVLLGVPMLVAPAEHRILRWCGWIIAVPLALAVLVGPSLKAVREFAIAKAQDEKGQMDEEWYRKYLRFQPADVIRQEGTEQAMVIFEEQELVRIYRQTGLYGEGWLSPPIPRRKDNFLNDYATSVFVQGQFGKLGAFALLVWACGMFWLGAVLPSDWLQEPGSSFWTAVAKGACWIWATLTFIMTASNLGLFPLTGKNAMLLGLNSGSDVLEATVVAFLACWGARRASNFEV